jgi:N-acetylmuramoyl-L-alanine amidase
MHTMSRIVRTRPRTRRVVTGLLVLMCLACSWPVTAADSAEAIYGRALGRERELRGGAEGTLTQLRRVVQNYESIVRRYPRSPYCDNALWQGANLAFVAFERFGQPPDRRTGVRLLSLLRKEYPSSSLAVRVPALLKAVESRAGSSAPPATPPPAPPALVAGNDAIPALDSREIRPAAVSAEPSLVTIREIRRTPLADGIRVTIEMDGEALYRSERLENPRRVFFDVSGARTTAPLQDATLKFTDDVVREIRLGRHPKHTTRVVMDLESVEAYSVFALYNPFRLVVDFKRDAAVGSPTATTGMGAAAGSSRVAGEATAGSAPAPAEARSVPAAKEPVPLISRPTPPPLVTPAAPTTNSNGQFSMARQLGLGVSRVVLDAGHGGHDPGARANGLNEAELVLDVTLRLKALLEKEPGIEVTLTRDTDRFIPLEERTAIANREGADLFLSIHANASRNPRARGIETYFLNFASNPEAEAVAARENSASGRKMHSLPDIVRAIALNNKIDESRDFADMVQKSMVRRLAARNSQVRDLGVKQAPFVVLIGASMPSVLAEISFVTNKQDGTLLKTDAYRQQIAESLFDAVLRYQRSLRGVRAVAARE